jgi:leader peptidase (prepilin peptidase)/N-methyltransferase
VTDDLLLLGYSITLGVVVGEVVNFSILVIPQWLDSSWRQQCRFGYARATMHEVPLIRELISDYTVRRYCPYCRYEIQGHRRVAILNWFFYSGSCPKCGELYREPRLLPQLVTITLTVAALVRGGLEVSTLFVLAQLWLWIILAFLSLRHQLIPDVLTYTLIWLGLMASLFDLFISVDQAVLGAVIGYLVPWSCYQCARLIWKKEMLGYGIFKGCAAIGACLGAEVALIAFLGAVVIRAAENLWRHRRIVTEDGLLPMGQCLGYMAILSALFKLGSP